MNDADHIFGVWSFASETPDELQFIEITSSRILESLVVPSAPKKRIPMNLWYVTEAPGTWRVRLSPRAEGTLCDYSFEGDLLVIRNRGSASVFRCSRVPEHSVPEWLREWLKAGHARMDEIERKAKAAT